MLYKTTKASIHRANAIALPIIIFFRNGSILTPVFLLLRNPETKIIPSPKTEKAPIIILILPSADTGKIFNLKAIMPIPPIINKMRPASHAFGIFLDFL